MYPILPLIKPATRAKVQIQTNKSSLSLSPFHCVCFYCFWTHILLISIVHLFSLILLMIEMYFKLSELMKLYIFTWGFCKGNFVGWLVGSREDIESHLHSLRSTISIRISNDTLTLNKQKERKDKLIYTYLDIWCMHNIHVRNVNKKYRNMTQQIKCTHIFLWISHIGKCVQKQ